MTSPPQPELPPGVVSFAEVLRSAMAAGVGKEYARSPVIARDRRSPWLVKQLAIECPVSEATLSSWRTGRSIPAPHAASRLIYRLTGDGSEYADWRDLLRSSYQNTRTLERAKPRSKVEQLIIPRQNARAFTFSIKDKMLTFVDPDIDVDSLSSNYSHIYNALKEEAEDILELFVPGANQHKDLYETILSYLRALGPNVAQMRRGEVWRIGRKLRKFRSIDIHRHEHPDPEDQPLNAQLSGGLGEVVVLHNTISSLDPALSRIDRRGSDPADRPIEAATSEARMVVDRASSAPGMIEPRVPESLRELLSGLDDQSPESRRDRVIGVDSTRNVVIVLASQALLELREQQKSNMNLNELKKGFSSAVGATAVAAITTSGIVTATAFIVTYASELTALVSRLPGGDVLATIISWIVRSVTGA